MAATMIVIHKTRSLVTPECFMAVIPPRKHHRESSSERTRSSSQIRSLAGPTQLDSLCLQQCLKLFEQLRILAHRARNGLLFHAERRQQAGGFSDVPFHGVQTIAAIRDVR